MKRKIQALVVILLLSVLLPNAFSCANPSEELPDPGAPDNNGDTPTPGEPSHKDPSESGPDSPTDTKPPQSDRLISADLNGDGTKDSISITLEETQRSNATIEITDGKDGTVLLSDTLAVGAPKIGAYYLKIGKAGNPNELVHWNYVLRDQRLHFSASTFSFGVDGKPAYRMSESKAFDLSPQAAVSSGNILFGVVIDEINENIQADCLSYSTYLLLSNQVENLSVSTESNLLSPSNLTFTLENFVDSEETNTPPRDLRRH